MYYKLLKSLKNNYINMSEIKTSNQYLDQETKRVLNMHSQMGNVTHLQGLQMTPASVTKFVTGRGKQFKIEFKQNNEKKELNIVKNVKEQILS
jgi:hypothetical protein